MIHCRIWDCSNEAEPRTRPVYYRHARSRQADIRHAAAAVPARCGAQTPSAASLQHWHAACVDSCGGCSPPDPLTGTAPSRRSASTARQYARQRAPRRCRYLPRYTVYSGQPHRAVTGCR